MTAPHPAGWYPAADKPGFERRWDGQQWTDQMRYAGGQEPPTAPKPPAPKRGVLVLAGVVVALVAAFSISNLANEDEREAEAAEKAAAEQLEARQDSTRASEQKTAAAKANAELLCEKAVTNKLKSPSTADFPDQHKVIPKGGNAIGYIFEVRGVVDSQNGFGATARSYFGCTVTPTSGGQYNVTVDELFTP